ncbi:MAG TPA: hybrid sensor histidine kinase/response regulator, partial [Bdellovibrionota bacterium]|nr:hybrid sensor histidine kinase/response regulator [Bdellovibrionota bacterium]
ESGKMQLVREPQDITAVLRECRDTLGILAKQKGLELKYRVTDTPTYVVGDRARLVQIFMNLLSNALKYTKKGSVELSLEQKDYALMIRVRDTGVGLRADELEQLFQKFYRGRSALESAEQGTGLGLVIVRGLVEAHGGTISAESEEGVGTTFTVSLPVEELASVMVEDVRESRGHQMARDEGSLPEGWKRTVWHVGGDAEKAKRLSEMLADPDFSVRGYRLRFEWFSSAENMPQDRSPELIVAEGGMASSDGVGGIKRRVGGRTPILVLGERQQASDVFSWGAAAFLNKPVKREQLAAAVKDLLHSRGRRVLLADPNTDARLLVKRGLEQRGFEVDDVDRGNQVLGRLEKETYDLLVLERDLPDVPAMEILKVVQRIPRYGGLRVVLLENAGGIAAAERREFEALGVGRFVAKYEGIDPTVDSVCRYLEEGRASSQ